MFSKRLNKFAGIDLSSDPAAIDAHRSPDALNVIAHTGGFPEKRVGWRILKNYGAKINGIFALGQHLLVHAGDKIIRGDEILIEGVNDAKSTACVFCEKLYILTGAEFLVYDGESIKQVRDIATAPQVLSQADQLLRNGIYYQPFNMLTTRRKVGITIPETGINYIVIYQRVDKNSVKLFYKDTGEQIDVVRRIQEDWDTERPKLRLELAETIKHMGVGDNLILEYDLVGGGSRGIIEKCTFITAYENRLFVGGNPDHPNVDFYSELNDGTYFSDVSYTNVGDAEEKPSPEEEEKRANEAVGSSGTKILGYSHFGNYLAIHKNGEGTGAAIYLRRAQMGENGMYFPIAQGIVGESIVSHRTLSTLIDDPLFLTRQGVYALAAADVSRESSLQSRSTRINSKLINEPGLEEAVCCSYRGYYMIFVNGRVYVADSRQKSYVRNLTNHFEYEWYLWDNVPASVVLSHDDVLYFGDGEGNLCRFNTDMTDGRGGYAMHAYNDNGAPICAYWSTKFDDDGDFNGEKLLIRRGSGVYVKTYGASDVELMVRTERDFGKVINFKKCRLFNFKSVDFRDFSFNTAPFSFIPFGRKVKGYRLLQVVCRNDKLNQALGIISIQWRYKKGKTAK